MIRGTLIPLAWPETTAIKEGKWYDWLMEKLGFIKNGFWHVGHAAMLLVRNDTGEIFYSDFGRYQTPNKKGRVRILHSDPDIKINSKAIFQGDKVINMEEILSELSQKEATHGEGRIIASQKGISDFKKAQQKSHYMHHLHAIPYGPFTYGGTNCSRYVSQVASVTRLGLTTRIFHTLPYTLTPTPITNIKIINDYGYFYEFKNGVLRKKKNFLYPHRKRS